MLGSQICDGLGAVWAAFGDADGKLCYPRDTYTGCVWCTDV